MTLWMPNSGGQLDHDAPSDAAASAAATASGTFGMYAATASPGPTPNRPQPGGYRRRLLTQIVPRPLRRCAGLVHADDGDAAPAAGKDMLRIVQRRAGEPPCALDTRSARTGRERLGIRRVRLDAEVVPVRRPEAANVLHRPAPQFLIVRETKPARLGEPPLVVGEARPGPPLVGWRPEQRTLDDGAASVWFARGHRFSSLVLTRLLHELPAASPATPGPGRARSGPRAQSRP